MPLLLPFPSSPILPLPLDVCPPGLCLEHTGLLLLDLLDDVEGRVEESIDTVFETRSLASTELGTYRAGDTPMRIRMTWSVLESS